MVEPLLILGLLLWQPVDRGPATPDPVLMGDSSQSLPGMQAIFPTVLSLAPASPYASSASAYPALHKSDAWGDGPGAHSTGNEILVDESYSSCLRFSSWFSNTVCAYSGAYRDQVALPE